MFSSTVYFIDPCSKWPKLRLRDQWGLPERRDVLFRCDSPVLIVSATWHEKKARFSSALQRQLAVSYAGHEDWVGICLICNIAVLSELIDHARRHFT